MSPDRAPAQTPVNWPARCRGASVPASRRFVLIRSPARFNPEKQSDPRCVEAPFFVALGNGEHEWQCLERTYSVTVAF
jgi:hypothetical protein